MEVLLSDLLQMESMRWSHVIAGIRGLSCKVKYIDVWEIPEIGENHKADVLFLSSGYLLRDNAVLQRETIARLVEAGVAALAIQQGYCTPIPEIMLEQANSFNFPLIELPREVSFTEIIHQGMQLVSNRQGDFLHYSQEFHQRLAEVVLAEGGLTDIARVLASLLQNTVILVDHEFHILGVGDYFVENRQGTAVGKNDFSIRTLERLLATLKKTGFVDRVKRDKKAQRVEFLFSSHGEQAWVVVPVVVKNQIYGFAAILENHRRLETMEWNALQQACDIIAMAVYKQRAYALLQQKQQQELVFDILNGKVTLDKEVLRKTAELGWLLNTEQVIMSLDLINIEEYYPEEPDKDNKAYFYHAKEQLLAVIANQIKRRCKALLTVHQGTRLLFICQLQAVGIKKQDILEYAEQVRQAAADAVPNVQLAMVISRICCDPAQLQSCYEETKTLLTIRQCVDAQAGIYRQSDFAEYQLLVRLRGTEEIRGFYHAILGPLEKLDIAAREEMLKTLESYFAANGSISRAADMIYLHRNSFKYRLGRLSELLHINIEDGETQFRLQLALRARHFLEEA